MLSSYTVAVIILFIYGCATHTVYVSQGEKMSEESKRINMPKIVWVYFELGLDNAGMLAQTIYKHNKVILDATGWQYRILDESNLQKYINMTEVDDFVQHLSFYHITTKADLIRKILMRDYGGVWMDVTIYLLRDLNWLYSMNQNPDIQARFPSKPEVFLYTNSLHDCQRFANPRAWLENNVIVSPNYENWFIASQPNASFIIDWINAFKEVGPKNYSTFIHEIQKQGVQLTRYQTNPYFRAYTSKALFLWRKQKEVDTKYPVQQNQKRHYGVQQYKVWTMQSNTGALAHEGMVMFNEVLKLQFLTQITAQDMYDGFTAKYMIKIPGNLRNLLQRISSFDQTLIQHLNNQVFPSRHLYNFTGDYRCLNEFYILKDSLAYFLLTDNGTQNLDRVRYYDQKDIPWVCRHFFFQQLIVYSIVSLFLFIAIIFALFQEQCKTLRIQTQKKHTQQDDEIQIQSEERHFFWINFIDIVLILLLWIFDTLATLVTMLYLKVIHDFMYFQWLNFVILTVLSYKIISSYSHGHIEISKKWKNRFFILSFCAFYCIMMIYFKDRYYYHPNESFVSEMMMGSMTLKSFLAKSYLKFFIIVYALMEIILQRNIYKHLKKSIVKHLNAS